MFDLFRRGSRKTMMEAVAEKGQNPAVCIIDVRTRQEFSCGHVPCALNVPLDQLERVQELVPDKGAPVYLYCASGGRSMMAAGMLKRMGYEGAANVGGIGSYTGPLDTGA